jgi:hypothetical protein
MLHGARGKAGRVLRLEKAPEEGAARRRIDIGPTEDQDGTALLRRTQPVRRTAGGGKGELWTYKPN